MGNFGIDKSKFNSTNISYFIPGKPSLQAIYGPWNSKEEAIEALNYCNVRYDSDGNLVTEIPPGSTVAIYDNPSLPTSVTEYWWKDGGLVQKSNNNSLIYAIVTNSDFIVYNDVVPTPTQLTVKRVNYGLNNISQDMDFGKLAYKVDDEEWKYITQNIYLDEEVIYDSTNKCFVFYLNNLNPLSSIQFRWYAVEDDQLGELLTTKTLLVTATANDIQEFYYQTDDIDKPQLIDITTMVPYDMPEFPIPANYDTDPDYVFYYSLYQKNNNFKIKTGNSEWTREMPVYTIDNQFNYIYKVTRVRSYGRWQPYTGPELVFIKGKDGSIKYEEVFYTTSQFGAQNLIDTSDFNLRYSSDYDNIDSFEISNGVKSETWSRTCPETTSTNLYRYARKRFQKSDGTYSIDWSYPYLHATYKPSDQYENIYKKSTKQAYDDHVLTNDINSINQILSENPTYKFSDLTEEQKCGWDYSAQSLEEPGDIICLALEFISRSIFNWFLWREWIRWW